MVHRYVHSQQVWKMSGLLALAVVTAAGSGYADAQTGVSQNDGVITLENGFTSVSFDLLCPRIFSLRSDSGGSGDFGRLVDFYLFSRSPTPPFPRLPPPPPPPPHFWHSEAPITVNRMVDDHPGCALPGSVHVGLCPNDYGKCTACFVLLIQVEVCSLLSKLNFLCFVSVAAAVLACGASLSGGGEIEMIYQTFCVGSYLVPPWGWWLGRRC